MPKSIPPRLSPISDPNTIQALAEAVAAALQEQGQLQMKANTVKFEVIKWLLGVAGAVLIAWASIGNRITTLEQQQKATDSALSRIESATFNMQQDIKTLLARGK